MVIKLNKKLSVLLITYNHASFIAECIESILMQKTAYDIEIIIVDDCSNDGAQKIILDYENRFPKIISAHINKVNIGTNSPPAQKVFYDGFKRLTGDYIAILEGDDYWSSNKKVEKQINFLEKNHDYVACAHNTVKVYEDKLSKPHRFLYWENTKNTHEIYDFIEMTSFFHTSSIIYRNVLCNNPPIEFKSKWSCDIFNTISHMRYGKLWYFDEDMSVYRQHAGGNFSRLSEVEGRLYNLYGLIKYNKWLKFDYDHYFTNAIVRLSRDLLDRAKTGEIKGLTFLHKNIVIAVWVYYRFKIFFRKLKK